MHTGVRDLQGSSETYVGGGCGGERIRGEQSLTGGEEAYRARG